MRILFVLENLTYSCGANVQIALNLVERIREKHEVFALTREDETTKVDPEKKRLFKKVFLYKDYPSETLHLVKKKSGWELALKNRLKILFHPVAFYFAFDFFWCDSSLSENILINQLDELCSQYNFNVMIGVAIPYYIARAIANSSFNGCKMLLQLDPYSNNYSLPHFKQKRRMLCENQTISAMSCVFAAKTVYDELKKYIIPELQNKLVEFEIPGIRKEYYCARDESPKEKINCLFLGRFYRDIRNPEFLLKLFAALPDQFILHLVGEGTEDLIAKFIPTMGSRLVIHGKVSSEESSNMMRDADILVNLNNSITNQIPSKIFQYISTGKPILNICKSGMCPSLDYINKYHNAVTIFEAEGVNVATQKVVHFTENMKNISISWEEIEKNYFKNTYDFAAGEIIRYMEIYRLKDIERSK